MSKDYFFSINNQQAGPFNAQVIKEKILNRTIAQDTLAWCEGMHDWQPLSRIPELADLYAKVAPGQTTPPPLPTSKVTPPPLNANSLNDRAYQLVCRLYPPFMGKPSPLRKFVDANPQSRALPVAAGTIILLVMLVIVWAASFSSSQRSNQTAGQQPQMPSADMSQSAAWQAQYRAMRDAQSYSQDVVDDAYQYRRDTQDRMDETYRRGTYDWYRDNDN